MRSIFARRSATISSGVMARAGRGAASAAAVVAAPSPASSSLDFGRLRRIVHRLRAGEQAFALELRRLRRRPRRASPAPTRRMTRPGAPDRLRRLPARRRAARLRLRTRFERAARLADAPILLVEPRRGAPATARRPRAHGSRSSSKLRRLRVERRLPRRRSPRRSSARRDSVRCEIVAARRRARASSSRVGLLEPLHLDGSALARSTSAACVALASAVRCACACIASRASNSRRCAAIQLVVGRPLIDLDPRDRLRALRPAALPARAALLPPSAARWRSAPACGAIRSTASRAVPICSSKPTTAFSWRCSSPCSDSDGGLRPTRSSTSTARELLAQALDRRRARPPRARAVP